MTGWLQCFALCLDRAPRRCHHQAFIEIEGNRPTALFVFLCCPRRLQASQSVTRTSGSNRKICGPFPLAASSFVLIGGHESRLWGGRSGHQGRRTARQRTLTSCYECLSRPFSPERFLTLCTLFRAAVRQMKRRSPLMPCASNAARTASHQKAPAKVVRLADNIVVGGGTERQMCGAVACGLFA